MNIPKDMRELVMICVLLVFFIPTVQAIVSSRLGEPVTGDLRSLVLISGSTGTGKSTFGMEVAISQGILKCISTDTIRQVMRPYVPPESSPSLHRSSYDGSNNPVEDWKDCCDAVQDSLLGIVSDSIRRGVSLVLEGVLIVPNNKLIDLWTAAGGVAVGCVLSIPDPALHKQIIFKRGEITGKGAEDKLNKYTRVRAIQDEMNHLATQNGWSILNQMTEVPPHPVDFVNDKLRNIWLHIRLNETNF